MLQLMLIKFTRDKTLNVNLYVYLALAEKVKMPIKNALLIKKRNLFEV
jgi:hypothetical protein